MISKKLEELEVLIEYGAPGKQQEKARALVDQYSHDPLAINILHNFYSQLPDATEDCVEELILLEQQQGQALFLVKTPLASYFYLADYETACYGGSEHEGLAEELLPLFGFSDQESFAKKFCDSSGLSPYPPDFINTLACPACYCLEGEIHELGCPVEVCPWCDGQLISCNCRFQQLGVSEIHSERQVDRFLQLVQKKGRIVYDATSQRPAYPTAGDEPKKTQ